MRGPSISRLYLQAPNDERIEEWHERIWDELEARLGAVNRGEIFDKGITPMRSFVPSPCNTAGSTLPASRSHRPPHRRKGPQPGCHDVRLLAAALRAHYERSDDGLLEGYSTAALAAGLARRGLLQLHDSVIA